MSCPSSATSAGSIGLGPIREEDSNTNISVSDVPQEDPAEPLPNANERPINLSDEERDTGEPSFGRRRFTSAVWEHYKRQKIGEKWKAICNHCKKQLGGETKNGTKHLHDHLKRCVFSRHDNTYQTTLNLKKDATSGKVTMSTYSFDPDKCRYSLVKMVILHEYSLSMVDHIGFREILHDLQPLFKVPSRNTLKSDILKIYEYEKAKNMIALEKIESRISITTDIWTFSNQKKGFMVITAHFIDDTWKLQSRIIRFIYVPCPHTTDVLSKILLCNLLDWNIDRKLLTLTVNNCTTNDAMINIVLSELESFLDEPILPRLDDFDILTWWKVNAIKYPTLSQIAKYILAIPVSTVAFESAFSTSGRFISSHRNRFHPKTLEVLMCTQDWLWADIHANFAPSTYFGCCSKMNDENIDDEEPSCVISSSADE